MTAPSQWNWITTMQLPPSVIFAKSAEDQIDAIYDIADDPATPRYQANMLLAFLPRLLARCRHR